jgi:glucose/arabinose dehydrogenase
MVIAMRILGRVLAGCKRNGIHRTALLIQAIVVLVLSAAPLRAQSPPIALIQHAGKDAGTTLTSSLAFNSNNIAGNWIAVVIRGGLTGQAFTVTDTRGNTYRQAIQYSETVDKTTLGLYYAESIAGGANTVTVSNSVAGTLRFAILEYAGVAPSNSLDVTSTAQGTSASPNSGSATTTSAGDLVIGMLSTADPRTFTAGGGYVMQELVPAVPNTKLAVESRILTAAGPVSAAGTLNTSNIWGAAFAAFRPGSGGQAPPPSVTLLSPASGPPGAPLTIAGANFGATQGTSTVTFNGTLATVSTWSATSLVSTVPGGATSGPLVVTVNGVASNGVTFAVVAGADAQAPTTPGNLTATVVAPTQVSLSWNAATDNVGVVEYRVEQCQGNACATFAEITRVSAGTASVVAPLTASANPNYFKDGSGTPLILNGSHTWNDLQDWGTNGTLQPLDFNAYVNTLVASGHNFTLLWYIELPKFCGFPTTAGTPPDYTVGPHPWQRTGPGNATDGAPKFDLTKYNQAYFDRLRARVQALNNAGIYVGVYTFTAEWVGRYRCATDGYPFTGANNVNGVDDGGGASASSFTMSSPNAITAVQDAYVERVIDTLNDLPNVLWMVSEEAPPNANWWNDHQIAHIRSYESGKPNHHPIGYATPAGGDPSIVNSDADWISGTTFVVPTTSCGSGTPTCKVNVNDSDHSYYGMWNDSAQTNRNFAWQNFTNGNQVMFMDPYALYYSREGRNPCPSPTNGICSGPDPRWTNFRDNLGYILRYSRKLNLANVTPRGSLCSTTNCLAQTPSVGAEYLIYAQNGGAFTVDLSAMSSARTLTVEWFNPSTGATTVATSISSGSTSQSFTPPFSGDAVLYLVDAAGHAGASVAPSTSFSVTGLAPGIYSYRVRAADAAGNLGAYSNIATANLQTLDTTLPSVALSAPANNAIVAGTAVTVSANASDNVGVAGVQFLLDGAALGVEDTAAPYSMTWNTTTATNASHVLTARARDIAGNVATAAAMNVTVANPASSGPAAAYPFNDGAGTTALDASGNGLTATLTNGPTWVAGKYGSAVRLDGVNDYVNLGNPAALQITGSMTISAWINSSSFPFDDAAIVSKRTSGVTGYQLDTTLDRGPRTAGFKLTTSSGTNMRRYGATALQANTWYYVTGVYSASAQTMNVYLNGQLDNGALDGTVTATQQNSTLAVNIGQRPGTPGPYNFVGAIDDVRIYARALTQAEIAADMNSPIGSAPDAQPPTAPSNLLGTATSASQIDLSWTASTDNVGVAGYLIERCAGAGCATFGQVAALSGTGTTYSNTGLTPGTSYSYRVRANDALNNLSAYSAVRTVVTPTGGSDTTPPVVSMSSPATNARVAGAAVVVSATASDGVGVAGVQFLLDGANLGTEDTTAPYSITWNTATATNAAHVLAARARDVAGNTATAAAVNVTVDNQAPTGSIVINGGATVTASTSVALTLLAADNGGVVAEMQFSNTGTSFSTAEPYATSKNWTLTTGSGAKTVYVQFKDSLGNWSSAFMDTIVLDTTAPTISGVSASSVTSSSATITWATNEAATSQVEYGTTAAYGTTTPIDISLAISHSTVVTGLAPQTTYTYRVRSKDAAGNEALGLSGTFATSSGSGTGTFQNEVLISGMNLPTALQFMPGGDMLILELGGKIWRVPAGTTQVSPTPFLSLTNIGALNGQQGLMGMVLDPDFENNHYYYVFYTLGTPNCDRVSRFTVTADHSSTVPSSEFVVYQDPQTANVEHHGGALSFGNDGKLYITTGEHFDPPAAQSLTSPRGKILRVNTDGTIPTDNPFYDGAGPNRDDIWALGLRNPFRSFFDKPSGKLYIADVGGNDYATAREEVNIGVAGANYGWPNCEGSSCGSNPTFTSPIYSYGHNGRDASITGGFIYRGSQYPAQYYGSYFFADYTQNWIRRLTFDASGNVNGTFNFEPPDGSVDGPFGDIVFLTEGPEGALYYVDLGYSDTTGQSGISKIRRIRFIPDNLPPTVVAVASPMQGLPPLTVNFSSAGSADPEGQPLTYAWTFGDGTVSTQANPVHVYAQAGQYTARVTASDGAIETSSVPLIIAVGNRPVARILTPTDRALFRGGDVIFISGDATDVEDGNLQPSAFTWAVDFLHSGHVHPGLPTVGAKSFTFDIPTSGHDFSGDTRYRVTLTVTDSDGLQSTQVVIIYPDKVTLSFDSVPSGVVLNLDGLPLTTPFVHDTLINFQHTLEAPNQILGSNLYTFTAWSDVGAQQHVITVPSTPRSYTASYTVATVPFPPGLVAGYRLNEGAGAATADISGNNTTGTLVNSPTWATGVYGNALTFGGANYVDLGNPASLKLTGSMTLSAWINISANPADDGAIVAKLGIAGWQLKTSPDTGARTAAIQISSNGSDSIQRYSGTVLAANTWYHVAGVYDAAARTLSVFVNGTLDNGVLSGTVPAAQFDANFNVDIAQRTGLPGGYNFQGGIDEVHIFNRALSAPEIRNDMNLPR